MRQHLIFDLDGTISNPQQGIVNGYHYAFEKMGLPGKTEAELIPLIGPPLRVVFSENYSFSKPDTDLAIQHYRDYYYGQGGMYENFIFEGMKEMLHELHAKKYTLHVATNKGLHVDKILDFLGVLPYFTSIEHYNEEKGVTQKHQMLTNILTQQNTTHEQAMMIGDREHDILAAHHTGMSSIGVLYGFGSKDEMDKCAPTYLAASVGDLRTLLI
jgi:phosphoglycolate phosphatase